MRPPLRLPLVLAFAGSALAQSNTVSGLDLQLTDTWALRAYQRVGTYPNGMSAIGAWTTCCNPGTVPVPFQAAMSPDHGFIHYLVARESDGRLVQISNWSHVKHTFGSNNNASGCGSCAGPGNFSLVEVGCSDTYANSQAVDHYNLGPPDEIDPWLGTWVPICSYFDQGEPAAAPAQLCDGVRSLTHAQANVLNQTIVHQMRVHDDEFDVPGADFYWQAGYLVPAEGESNRANNIGSRQVNPSWNGSAWAMTDGVDFLQGTILQRWTGASIDSNTNGTADGRYYVAVKVTGPVEGLYHYEYAVHNRDNRRGMGALRIPICSEAMATNFGAHDVDRDPLNDWTGAKVGAEIVFTGGNNPLRWNSLFNFWFDSDAAPVTGGAVGLDQYELGAGALTVQVNSTTPTGLYNVSIGPGCGAPAAPHLYGSGSPDRAQLGNSGFALRSSGNPSGVLCGFAASFNVGTTTLAPGCTLYSASLASMVAVALVSADLGGMASIALGVPAQPALEGMDIDFQSMNLHTGGAYANSFDLSNGLRVRVGSLISACP